MSETNKQVSILLTTEEHMPAQSRDALEHFLVDNPRMQGAHWADVLDMLLDADAHVNLTDTVYDELRTIVPLGTEGWILPVFLTLLYANKGVHPYMTMVAYWHGRVTGMVEKGASITR